MIAFIRPEAQQKPAQSVSVSSSMIGIVSEKPENVIIEGLTPAEMPTLKINTLKSVNVKKVLAVVFALISGFFYGEDVTPVIYIQDQYKGAPQDMLSYCYSHYMGVFLTASFVFMAYCVVKKNKPYINDELTFPSFISGLLWGLAQTIFMISVQHMSQAVSGSIGAIFPACTATLWSVFYFKEIKGTRNLLFLFGSIAITSTGALMIGLSKEL